MAKVLKFKVPPKKKVQPKCVVNNSHKNPQRQEMPRHYSTRGLFARKGNLLLTNFGLG